MTRTEDVLPITCTGERTSNPEHAVGVNNEKEVENEKNKEGIENEENSKTGDDTILESRPDGS